MTLRVLCLDIDGGYGGSSRSLYESLRHVDRTQIAPEVWCRRDGPIRPRYESLGIPCRVVPGMPKMNSLRLFSRNVIGYATWYRDFLAWHRYRDELVSSVQTRFDVVHFNHEGLFGLASWLRRTHKKTQTMHVRTMMLDNVWGRRQARAIASDNDAVVFITENERDNLEKLARTPVQGRVIYNIAEPNPEAETSPAGPDNAIFKVAVLMNYAEIRGTDRVVELAENLAARGQQNIVFVVAGNMSLPRSSRGDLGVVAKQGGSLEDYALTRGVGHMMKFLGHVDRPEQVLQEADVLLKPSRLNDPWSRDILEALASRKPVLAIGTYSTFVEDGVTGYLFPKYSPDAIADAIVHLGKNRELCRSLGEAGARRIVSLCNPRDRAGDLVELWQGAVTGRRKRWE